jgi:hypothetical protein
LADVVPPIESGVVDEALGCCALGLAFGSSLSPHMADGSYCRAESVRVHNVVVGSAPQVTHNGQSRARVQQHGELLAPHRSIVCKPPHALQQLFVGHFAT